MTSSDPGRLHLHQVAAHPGAFQLEYADCTRLFPEARSLRVVKRDAFRGSRSTPWRSWISVTRTLHDGKGGYPKEIDLEQAEVIDNLHLELDNGLDGVVLGVAGGAVQRSIFDDGLVRNDHTGRMGACIANARPPCHGQYRSGHGYKASRYPRWATLKSGTFSRVESIVYRAGPGRILATRSTSESGMSLTRPTSRMAALAPSVPKVMIWATWSRPYLSEAQSPSPWPAGHPGNPGRCPAWRPGRD